MAHATLPLIVPVTGCPATRVTGTSGPATPPAAASLFSVNVERMLCHTAILFACALSLSAAPALDVWNAKSEVRAVEPGAAVKLTPTRTGDLYRARLTNTGKVLVHVTEVSLFRIAHDLPDATALYGESFQMLSQTGGTLAKPVNLGYDELAHYKIPQPADAKVVTGMVTLTPPGGDTHLLGFTSCRRFNGRFYLRPKSI